ncbi:MAG: hypothetical protein F6K22_04070 [Okeania sp. SIO2F4]|uniref:hypothetical protein n=1 Tax=Okeania sp. SIO2F4 TaxID=2607790 RepID=UPI00142D17E1|nr:hypothetical protein [Okeania sp. SIO2F4]NES02080.1 hypothetical protein [Okeania sp. SIO2F4]
MNIYELNYLENVKESSLVNGGSSFAYGFSQAFAKGDLTLAITKSIVSVSPNYAWAITSGSAYAVGGVVSTSSQAGASKNNVYSY